MVIIEISNNSFRSYNPAVVLEQLNNKKLKSLLPNKETASTFNRKITENQANHFGLK
jgi:hypothetical protein